VSVHSGEWDGTRTLLSYTDSRLSLTLEAPGQPVVLNFDLAGRPWSVLRGGTFYQRGLNGRVVAKWIEDERGRQRRWLSPEQARTLAADACGQAARLMAALDEGELHFEPGLDPGVRQALARAARYDDRKLEQDCERFHVIYRPVGILPPDQYQAVLLQATEGCSHNRCTFCEFYKGQPFKIKGPEAFRRHCTEVREFLGRGLSLRRTLFMGDANALAVPQDRLLRLFDIVHEVYDVEVLGGIFAFQDAFSGEKKDAGDYAGLRELGLARVYIGLESGHDPLLEFLNKPGNAASALHTVEALKAAGVPVGVIILLGAGGRQYARGHVDDSITVLNRMPLDMHDQIYFSELVESEGMRYTLKAFEASLQPLTPAQRQEQAGQIEGGLRFSLRGGTPHISRYDIREFVY